MRWWNWRDRAQIARHYASWKVIGYSDTPSPGFDLNALSIRDSMVALPKGNYVALTTTSCSRVAESVLICSRAAAIEVTVSSAPES